MMHGFVAGLVMVGTIFTWTGCKPPEQVDLNEIPGGVSKFRDGPVLCYTYWGKGISCLYLPEGN